MTIQQKLQIYSMSLHKTQLSLPALNPSSVIKTVSFQNTWRQGGIRMQQQNINDKQVFHNYGHGLAQYSLAYGTSYIVGKMVSIKKKSFRTQSCAVIGNTITALMTTLELLKRGLKVTLYIEKLPVRKENGRKVVSDAQGVQFWYPGDYDNENPVQHELIAKLSQNFFVDSLNTNRYQSLSWATVYVNGPKVEQLKQNVTEFLSKDIESVGINFGNEKIEEFTSFKTIQIDTELFTEEIFTQIRLRNTNIVERKFNSLDEILQLKEEMIFNCLGVENKTFFGDKAVSPIHSFYVSLKPQTPQKSNNFLWHSSQTQEQDGFVLALSKKGLQITTRNRFLQQQQVNNQKHRTKIFNKVYHFVKERVTFPSKL